MPTFYRPERVTVTEGGSGGAIVTAGLGILALVVIINAALAALAWVAGHLLVILGTGAGIAAVDAAAVTYLYRRHTFISGAGPGRAAPRAVTVRAEVIRQAPLRVRPAPARAALPEGKQRVDLGQAVRHVTRDMGGLS